MVIKPRNSRTHMHTTTNVYTHFSIVCCTVQKEKYKNSFLSMPEEKNRIYITQNVIANLKKVCFLNISLFNSCPTKKLFVFFKYVCCYTFYVVSKSFRYYTVQHWFDDEPKMRHACCQYEHSLFTKVFVRQNNIQRIELLNEWLSARSLTSYCGCVSFFLFHVVYFSSSSIFLLRPSFSHFLLASYRKFGSHQSVFAIVK